MGNKDKKAKSLYNNAEGATAAITTAKELLETARGERKTFAKDNGLSMKPENFDANSKDKKHGKKWNVLTAEIDKHKATIEAAEKWLTENKPGKKPAEGKEGKKSNAGAKPTKYEYPADCTSDTDKKKFRTKMRAEAAKAAKGEGKSKKEEGKKDKKSPAPAASATPSPDKSKKKKKAKKED